MCGLFSIEFKKRFEVKAIIVKIDEMKKAKVMTKTEAIANHPLLLICLVVFLKALLNDDIYKLLTNVVITFAIRLISLSFNPFISLTFPIPLSIISANVS